ncbi:MAG TPA: glycoside hydrolase family 127 protein [Bacteroidales bacterium]|nr:glycoside hydrolase family 127 protein [Bacteroidales bacterium]HPS74481.1 glycoside hydrolase family 127 protein [Bacteroidales bacterium]
MNFFRSFLRIVVVILLSAEMAGAQLTGATYPFTPVPFTSVKVNDHFWAPRIRKNHEVTIPIAIRKSRETGRIRNFMIAGKVVPGSFCSLYPFDDSDVYKIIEGASYSLQTFPDPELSLTLDTLIRYIALAQEPDGYLYTNRTIDSTHMHEWVGKKRWEKDPELSHELYNLGHLYEAAVAHYQATGKRTLLDVALKSADLVYADFIGKQLPWYPGHQVIEMGLVKLYGVTGDKKYLDLARYMLDIRKGGEEYNQAHLPVTQQHQIVGHAVRATYMYSGMADVAAITGDKAYTEVLSDIWNDLIRTKFYITGGIGSGGDNEGFGEPYYLPNQTAYCETCASIGNVFWNYRMFLLHGQSAYIDVLERTLYNALLSGVSLTGDRFFYPNPLESQGKHQRSEWFGCACCPSNICRFLPSIPGYIYAYGPSVIYLNLYIQNTATIDFHGSKTILTQTTDYPWSGKVTVTLEPGERRDFSLAFRIPGWARGEVTPGYLYHFRQQEAFPFSLTVNGVPARYIMKEGYAVIAGHWKAGDKVELDLPMPVQWVEANPLVEADRGKAALQRGPLVYCLEWPDQPGSQVLNMVMDTTAVLNATFDPKRLQGVEIITGRARQEVNGQETIRDITAIPYCLWANRGMGEMRVWIPVK